jgi:hypothetical protein
MIGPAPEVIAEYTGESLEAQPRQTGEIGDRWGTGEAQITSVEFLGPDERPLNYLTTNQPVTIRVTFTTHLPIDNPVVGIRITHLNGVNVWGANTKRRAAFMSRINGPGHVDIEIPSLPILEGTYEITVAISDQSEVHAYDHWEKRIRFDVHQHDIFDEGIVTVTSNWNVSDAEYKGR